MSIVRTDPATAPQRQTQESGGAHRRILARFRNRGEGTRGRKQALVVHWEEAGEDEVQLPRSAGQRQHLVVEGRIGTRTSQGHQAHTHRGAVAEVGHLGIEVHGGTRSDHRPATARGREAKGEGNQAEIDLGVTLEPAAADRWREEGTQFQITKVEAEQGNIVGREIIEPRLGSSVAITDFNGPPYFGAEDPILGSEIAGHELAAEVEGRGRGRTGEGGSHREEGDGGPAGGRDEESRRGSVHC